MCGLEAPHPDGTLRHLNSPGTAVVPGELGSCSSQTTLKTFRWAQAPQRMHLQPPLTLKTQQEEEEEVVSTPLPCG